QEAIKFYTGNLDARIDASAENNNSWKMVKENEKHWLEKMQDSFASLAEKISDAYFGTKVKTEEEMREEAEKREKKEREDREKKQTEEIEKLVEEKTRPERKAKEEKEKTEKNARKEQKLLNKISEKGEEKKIAFDIRYRISLYNNDIWKSIKDKLVSEEIKRDKKIGKRISELINRSKKIFKDEAYPKINETMEQYTKRIMELIYGKNKKINEILKNG
ncbi:MAG: hypothetical protein V1804_03385, partial [Patescibacteria group bacterium]